MPSSVSYFALFNNLERKIEKVSERKFSKIVYLGSPIW